MLRAKVKNVVCGARSFKYIYEVDFDKAKLLKNGPIMEDNCREIYVKWLHDKGLNNIIDSGTMEE